MTIVMDGLRYLAYILIFPGFLFCFLTGMLLCGIDRKLVARMQKRIGPPILQPFYDFFKLLGKETIVPAAANRTVFLLAPLVGLAAQVVLQLFIPVFHFNAFRGVADVIVILYLLLIPALSVILGAASSGSPYAGVGLSREMVTVLSVELPLVLVLLAVAKTVGNALGTGLCFSLTDIVNYQIANGSLLTRLSMLPAAAAMLLIIPGETGSHPFDAAEAFVALFLGGIGGGVMTLLSGLSPAAAGAIGLVLEILILFLLCVVLVAVCVSLLHAVTARLRIEQLFKYYWTVVTGLAAVSVVLAWYGL